MHLTRRIFAASLLALTLAPAALAQKTDAKPGILPREQAGSILPATVFFAGQSAPIQARNSAGIRTPDGKLVLAAMVDTSGYSTGLQQKYQAYLITETSLDFGGKRLAPGAYGFGFIENQKAIVMDIASNTLFTTTTMHDDKLARPTPLQILPGSSPTTFRLVLGRNSVVLTPTR